MSKAGFTSKEQSVFVMQKVYILVNRTDYICIRELRIKSDASLVSKKSIMDRQTDKHSQNCLHFKKIELLEQNVAFSAKSSKCGLVQYRENEL